MKRYINLKTLALCAGVLLPAAAIGQTGKNLPPVRHNPISFAWDVPAEVYTTPPSYPCNAAPPSERVGSGGFAVFAVCITQEETHYRCADSARVLLTSGDGVHHCILFPQQEEETVVIHGEPAPQGTPKSPEKKTEAGK